jgi:SRSO17 transposase
MLRGVTLPGALSRVLAAFRPCFTAPTFTVFTALVAGLIAQPVSRTVYGMLTGAGLARAWHHSRAHRFFSTARWQPHQMGLLLAELIVTSLLTADAPITLAVDDTLFRRRGKKIHAVGWFHDGSAAGQATLGYGNNWVVLAVIVTLPFLSRPVALPVLAALAVKGGASKPDLARDLLDAIAEQFPDRDIHLVADAAYGCNAFAGLGHGMTMTTRARANAVFSHPAPPRTGKRGRPRLKGQRIGTPADIAGSARWKTVTVSRYGATHTVQITDMTCLWYGTWRTDTVRVILVRDTRRTTKTSTVRGYDIALVSTDLTATPERIIARYAARWSIEVTFFDVKNILGVGQARNRVPKAVQRTVPFGLFCHSILIIWYTLHGHAGTDTHERRERAPWYRSKTEPSTLDMLVKLRRQVIAAQFLPASPRPATTQEIMEVQQVWAQAAA